jgi:hypothetical protein
MGGVRRVRWWDWLVYRLFQWRWGRILQDRPDLREFMIAHLKVYDVLDEGDRIKTTVTIELAEKQDAD